MTEQIQTQEGKKKDKGFLNPQGVKTVIFTVMVACVGLGVVVSILAIWDFAQNDVLWRTLATLGVIWLGCIIFGSVNRRFGD
ncbi:MAG: hypothetical protein GF333_06985 [Candidatus Omnitrophica bacterium]|nr:hypothetical protein [Candidatus Omnitrophota bacterium]